MEGRRLGGARRDDREPMADERRGQVDPAYGILTA
jgi:hypothetical protein